MINGAIPCILLEDNGQIKVILTLMNGTNIYFFVHKVLLYKNVSSVVLKSSNF